MPMLFSPTIGAAVTAGYWFLSVRCPACRTINAIDLRTLDRHRDAVVTSLIPALSCRSCRPDAPFAELVRLGARRIGGRCWASDRRARAAGSGGQSWQKMNEDGSRHDPDNERGCGDNHYLTHGLAPRASLPAPLGFCI